MTIPRIADIAERHARSTPGEWVFEHSHLSGTIHPVGSYAPVCSTIIPYEDAFEGRYKDCQAVRDVHFIAHAHQDIPFLLDLAKTQAAEIARLTTALAEAEERGRVKGIEGARERLLVMSTDGKRIIREAGVLEEAQDELSRMLGDDPEQWRTDQFYPNARQLAEKEPK